MSHVPPPWIIDEVQRNDRQRSEREHPRLELPDPPQPARPGDDEAEARVIVVVELSAADALTRR